MTAPPREFSGPREECKSHTRSAPIGEGSAATAARGAWGRLSEPIEAFAQPFWDAMRERVSHKAIEMRRQGFSGPAMLPWSELEYTGMAERLEVLDERFAVRAQPGA